MPRIIILFICGIILNSCATVLIKPHQNIFIVSEKPVSVIYEHDTLKSNEKNIIGLRVERSKYPLNFTISNDSIQKDIEISSEYHPISFLNIYTPLFVGYFVDRNHPGKYRYKSRLFFTNDLQKKNLSEPNNLKLHTYFTKEENAYKFSPQKKDWHFNFSFPLIYPSLINIKPNNKKQRINNSWLGVAIGIDYFYKNDNFISLSASSIFAGDIVFGCAFEPYNQERINIYNIQISHNHLYNKISFGYGLSYSVNDWWENIYEHNSHYNENEKLDFYTSFHEYTNNKYSTLGIVLNGYYYFTPTISAGIVYKPNFVRLNPNGGNKFVYEHTISLDVAFRIRLNKRSKQ